VAISRKPWHHHQIHHLKMAITRDKYGEPRHATTNSPSLGSNLESTISIFHPGYSDGSNKLLTLPAADNGGIYYGTALTICGIVAGNMFDTGFFAKSREAEPEASEWDSVLVGSRFYFFASADRLSTSYSIS
jgi:hypothetical protein